MNLKNLNLKEALAIAKYSRLLTASGYFILSSYYVLTIMNAFFDGISLILLIDLLAGKVGLTDQSAVMSWITHILYFFGFTPSVNLTLLLIISLFLIRAILYFGILVIEGSMNAKIRRKIQESGFTFLLNGHWEFLREIRVGECLGAITYETLIVTKYIFSTIRTLYFLITVIVLGIISLFVSFQITTIMLLVGVPALFFIQWIFSIQSKLSAKQMLVRQEFTASINEQLMGLFQIKVKGQNKYHIQAGLKYQKRYTRLEILLSYFEALTGTFDIWLPVLTLFAFYIWAMLNGKPISESLHLLAGVGILGARVQSQLSGFLSCWGNLSRFSGSIQPVHKLFTVPPESERAPMNETLEKIHVQNVSYQYSNSVGIHDVNFNVEKGKPLAIRGPSGSGKSTIANLIAGIYSPHKGKIIYIGESGKTYDNQYFKAHVGYIAQDIYLFHGTIRENLISEKNHVLDKDLWNSLGQVGATDFIKNLGGLDAKIIESGKSLSGGEKRRLGIARALLNNPDLLILDEIMSGLDPLRKKEISQIIEQLSHTLVIIAITHDEAEFESWNQWIFPTTTPSVVNL